MYLQIKDDGAGNENLTAMNGNGSNGKGLNNIRLRLEHLYGKNFRFELQKNDDGTQVDLEMPTELIKS